MEQRLERLEQRQIQMQEQLTEIQQDMRDQMNVMSQLTQLLAGRLKKGGDPVVDSVDDDENIVYSLISVSAQPDVPPQGAHVIIKPQCQINTSALLNFSMGSDFNPEDDRAKPFVMVEIRERGEWTSKAPKKKEREVNSTSKYNKGNSRPIMISQSKTTTTSYQVSPRQ